MQRMKTFENLRYFQKDEQNILTIDFIEWKSAFIITEYFEKQ